MRLFRIETVLDDAWFCKDHRAPHKWNIECNFAVDFTPEYLAQQLKAHKEQAEDTSRHAAILFRELKRIEKYVASKKLGD